MPMPARIVMMLALCALAPTSQPGSQHPRAQHPQAQQQRRADDTVGDGGGGGESSVCASDDDVERRQQEKEQQQQHEEEKVCGTAGEEVLADVPMRGMHVLRARPSSAVPHCGVAACPMFELEVHVDGMRALGGAVLTVACHNSSLETLAERLGRLVLGVRAAHPDNPPRNSVVRL
jgi:hypothetical protein